MPVTITSKQDGFRRCGVSHSKEPVEYPAGHWTPEQLDILKGEPMLVVSVDDGGGQPPGPPAGSGQLNAAETVKLVQAAASIEELDKLAEGETRKTVTDAIAKRRAELAPPTE